jgi:nicotinate-nucleotide--dimethylbenzimidazole phosphoribosyltransferase
MVSSGSFSQSEGDRFWEVVASVPTIQPEWHDRAIARLNNLTKPIGSLGRLEEIAKRLVGIREQTWPQCQGKAIFTLAADHGVTDEGISAYPKVVTRQMVLNFLSQGAAINVLCSHCGIDVIVVDIGVDGEFSGLEGLLERKVAHGTRNMAHESAMSNAEMHAALVVGLDLAETAAEDGRTLIGTGEMGIGNSTSASAITAALIGCPVARVTGRGTGVDDLAYQHKIRVVETALAANRPQPSDPLDILRKVGGLEIAGMTGLIVGAASRRIPVVIDGFISTASAAIACAIEPKIKEFIFAGHRSSEPGHSVLLEYIGQKPLLELEMRLGEGTGAALAMNIIEASARILSEMATFSSAGVAEAVS